MNIVGTVVPYPTRLAQLARRAILWKMNLFLSVFYFTYANRIDYVLDETSTSEDLFHHCLSDLSDKVTSGIKCIVFFLRDQCLGFLLGLGETSCDINTLFQGCETAKGLITLSVNDLLERAQRVLFYCLYECRMKTVFICYELV